MQVQPLCKVVVAATAVLGISSARPAAAQDGFFFKPPAATLELRVGRFAAGASGDIYQHMTENFTLGQKDFAATSFSADAAFRASDRVDVVVGGAFARSARGSESRNYVDQDDQPILQETRLTKIPLGAGVRVYPLSRGVAVGKYAWIPASFTPYAGAGVGLMHYKLEQDGDFVNYQDFSIFNDELQSSGNAAMAYGEAGAAYWMNHRVGLTGGARYTFAKAALRRDFEGFDDIDLSGFQASAGLALRF
jgi:hypothetical protein